MTLLNYMRSHIVRLFQAYPHLQQRSVSGAAFVMFLKTFARIYALDSIMRIKMCDVATCRLAAGSLARRLRSAQVKSKSWMVSKSIHVSS